VVLLLASLGLLLLQQDESPASAPTPESVTTAPSPPAPLGMCGVEVSPSLETIDALPAGAGSLAGCSLLLVTLDTTSADRLGCYGNAEVETPHLDRLAERGVVYSAASAVAPLTLPSHTSLLTGRYPASHGVRTNGFFRLQEEEVTLAERLGEEGYRTGAIVSAFVLDSQYGLDQGFDHYDDSLTEVDESSDPDNPSRRADRTTERALTWLAEAAGEPFFLWVHYFDPHYIYAPPADFAQRYAGRLHDGEVAYVDSQIGRLTGFLEERGLTERCLVVVAGDHGEGLGEHAEPTHGYLTYASTIHIPLIFSCGSRLGGAHDPGPVSQVDVMPTVLALFGLEPGEEDGLSLTEPRPADRPIYFESLAGTLEYGWEPLVGVQSGSERYLHSSAPELFDLARDPDEGENLLATSEAKPEALDAMLRELYGDELELAADVSPTVAPSAADLRQLQALGYVADGLEEGAIGEPAGRPQEMIALLTQAELVRNGALPYEDRVSAYQEMLREHPDFYPAWKDLGQLHVAAGKLEAGAEALLECLRLRPGTPRDTFGLAAIHYTQGRWDAALELLLPLLERFPDYLRARHLLGTILGRRGEWEQAAEQHAAVFASAPDYEDWMNANQMATAFAEAGRSDELRELFAAQLEQDPAASGLRRVYATQLTREGDATQAVELLREGLRLDPRDAQLAQALAQLFSSASDPKVRDLLAAQEVLAPFAEPGSEVPRLMYTLCGLYVQSGRMEDAASLARRARVLAVEQGDAQLVQAIDRQLGQ